MPRHPPFALSNLQITKNHISKLDTHQTPPPTQRPADHLTCRPQHPPIVPPGKERNEQMLRCSRPLCSSQRTTDPAPTDNTFGGHRPEGIRPKATPPPDDHSPNRNPARVWAFRTQQYALVKLSLPHPDVPPKPENGLGVLAETSKSKLALLNVPPMSGSASHIR